MDKFTAFALVAVGVWMLAGIKITYDQMKLFKAYKKEIDSSFPMSPMEEGFGLLRLPYVMEWRWRVVFSKYPDSPNLDMLAAKIHRDIIGIVCFFVLLLLATLIIG